MRKQYYLTRDASFLNNIAIYHDGVKVGTERIWDDELYDYIAQLQQQGYTRGFSKDTVEKARKEYEHLRDNLIEGV
jgi:hypothetical protein